LAYNYLQLVNDINARVNEVPLTSSNFASATGFYSDAKQAVNLALKDINLQEFEWPFNHVTKTLVLTVDQVRYPYEADCKSVAYDTFRIEADTSLNNRTVSLFPLDYEDYLQKYSDMEFKPTQYHGVPKNVFRTRELQFGVIPAPDKAYTLEYEYYSLPEELEDWDDVPTIPSTFKHVLHNGSMYYAYTFRGDGELALASLEIFNRQLKSMRKVFINRTEYARTSYIMR
jgi:hypothetical protein